MHKHTVKFLECTLVLHTALPDELSHVGSAGPETNQQGGPPPGSSLIWGSFGVESAMTHNILLKPKNADNLSKMAKLRAILAAYSCVSRVAWIGRNWRPLGATRWHPKIWPKSRSV